jgi:hypothetical protein
MAASNTRFTQNSLGQSKNLIDSDHGIYRDRRPRRGLHYRAHCRSWCLQYAMPGKLPILASLAGRGVANMPPTDRTSSVITEQLRRALGEAVIRIWSNLPQEVQDHLFNEAVASQGESIRSQLAVFLHDKHSRTSDPLGNPRETEEPDSLGG